MMNQSRSRTVIVTGGGNGIGAAISSHLASSGDFVAVVDKNELAAEKVASSILSRGGQAVAIQCDVSNESEVIACLSEVKKRRGTIECLINNAGVGGPFHTVDEVTVEEWDWIMGTNLKGVFLFLKHTLPEMKRVGFGRIINMASVQGLLGASRSSTYVASKHAVIGYTRAVAAEWGPFGVTCNAICPGYIDTQMGIQAGKVDEHLTKVLNKTPVGRVGKPDEVAALVSYLIDSKTGYMNGSVITLDGGISAHVGVS